ncbi:MAG: phosphotransferase family protein [Hominenteromicrobium sp.]
MENFAGWNKTQARLIGKGNTAEVYTCGEDRVCKLFVAGYPENAARQEFENAGRMASLGLPVPVCHTFLETDGRFGIIYERIDGDDLIQVLCAAQDVENAAETLARLHTRILNCRAPELRSYKAFIRNVAADKDPALLQKLEALPDGDALCHGDFHPGNVLFGRNGEPKVIDFMNLCSGPREYDIARSYYLTGFSPLPKDMEGRDVLERLRVELARRYLARMGVEVRQLEPYLEVIERCHRCEKL